MTNPVTMSYWPSAGKSKRHSGMTTSVLILFGVVWVALFSYNMTAPKDKANAAGQPAPQVEATEGLWEAGLLSTLQ